jgi:hypothetical protein
MPPAKGIYSGAAPLPLDFDIQIGRRVRGGALPSPSFPSSAIRPVGLTCAAPILTAGWKDTSAVQIAHRVVEDGAVQFQATIKELEEGEKYTVRCRAQNERGWSDWSKKSAMIGTAKTAAYRARKRAAKKKGKSQGKEKDEDHEQGSSSDEADDLSAGMEPLSENALSEGGQDGELVVLGRQVAQQKNTISVSFLSLRVM